MNILPTGLRSCVNPAEKAQHPQRHYAAVPTEDPDTFWKQQTPHHMGTQDANQRRALFNHLIQKIEDVRNPQTPTERQAALEHLRMVLSGINLDALEVPADPEVGQPATRLGPQIVALLAAHGTGKDIRLCQNLGINLKVYNPESAMTPTPLMQAVNAKNMHTVQTLLPLLDQHDLYQKNAFGETALDIPKRRSKAPEDPLVQTLTAAFGPFYLLHRLANGIKQGLTPSANPLALGDPEDFTDEGPLLLS
jgi:hypothetical protein